MFSLVLIPGQTHTVEISTPLVITNIAFGENLVGYERSLVKIRYFYADDGAAEDDDIEIVEEASQQGRPSQEAVIAALVPGQSEQFSSAITLDGEIDYVELSCTGQNAIHIIGHYQPSLTQSLLDGPLDGPDSDAESDSDWDCEEEDYNEADLELPPSLLAIKAQNDQFDLEQARKLIAEQEVARRKAAITDAENDNEYAHYKYTPPSPVSTAGKPFVSIDMADDDDEDGESDGDYNPEEEDEQMEQGSDGELSTDSEDEHELDILDMQRQAKGELAGIQKLMLDRRLEAAKKLVAEYDAKMSA